jgi:hypothetical protein
MLSYGCDALPEPQEALIRIVFNETFLYFSHFESSSHANVLSSIRVKPHPNHVVLKWMLLLPLSQVEAGAAQVVLLHLDGDPALHRGWADDVRCPRVSGGELCMRGFSIACTYPLSSVLFLRASCLPRSSLFQLKVSRGPGRKTFLHSAYLFESG